MVEEREGLENKGENGVRELELEVMNKTKELSCMEEATKVKDDLLQISEAARNSLEIDGLQKQAQIEKFQRIFGNMTTKIKRLEEDASVGNGTDVKGKVKKLIDELKEKSKKLEDSGKRNSDLMKKFGEETNLRAKAEAEVIRANKTIDYLHEIIENKKEPLENVKEHTETNKTKIQGKPRCLDQDRRGGCTYGDTCRFSHDVGRW